MDANSSNFAQIKTRPIPELPSMKTQVVGFNRSGKFLKGPRMLKDRYFGPKRRRLDFQMACFQPSIPRRELMSETLGLNLLDTSLPVIFTTGGLDTRDSSVRDLTAEKMASVATSLLPERIGAGRSVVAQCHALHEWHASHLEQGTARIMV